MSRAMSRAIPRNRTTAVLALAACAGLVAAMPSPASARTEPVAAAKTTHAAAKPAAKVSGYKVVKLVSDQVGKAALRDKKLVNAWGLALGPSSPLWVANNHSSTATVYSGGQVGTPISNVGLVVNIPGDDPTGQVFNGTNGFKLKNGSPATFLFDSESGLITGWNGSLTPSTKAVTVSSTANGNFKGLALLKTKGTEYLLATDFRHNKVVILNSKFAKVSFGTSAFHDSKLPAGYAPFNVAVIGSKVLVSYAKQDKAKDDDNPGAHHGYVDVYSAHGTLTKRLIKGGALNSPWGLTLAPKGFGSLAGSLLVGNFGDGLIHAYSLTTGHLKGTLKTSSGATIKIPGLWALTPGNGTAGAKSDIWFSAGPSGELHGLLGILRAA
jgi:uncharacterized protein (TIGR03118 family)